MLLDICKQEKCDIQDVVYVGDSLTKDMYMAITVGITSVWVNYSKPENNYYPLLVDISSWTEEDFKREKELKDIWINGNMKPDYEIVEFSELLHIVLDE